MSPQDLLESFRDLAPEPDDFFSDVVDGLSRPRKELPCKYFYDEIGSQLFEQICELPEYYPTRTESALLADIGGDLAACIGPHAHLIEYGCGSVQKVRILLDAVKSPTAYVAVDISREHLLDAAATLAADYPELEVHAICADFTKPFQVDPPASRPDARRVGFFPGSTLGNFTHDFAREFLANASRFLGPGGALVIGIDLKKDENILNAAYNDAQGITAKFNLNLLDRINRELGGDFDVEKFQHRAHYDPDEGRIEMHLLSKADQSVQVNGTTFDFREGETIHTENSHKYGVDEFQRMAEAAGFSADKVWVDRDGLFSVHYLTVP